jgi:hypothetical protein
MTRTKTRALANWPNNAVSVLDYGAVADGVTDDYAAINNALNNNTLVYFPPGNYFIGTEQLYPPEGTSIEMAPDAKITFTGLRGQSPWGLRIKGNIDGGQFVTGEANAVLIGTTKSTITNYTIDSTASTQPNLEIRQDGAYDIKIHGNTFIGKNGFLTNSNETSVGTVGANQNYYSIIGNNFQGGSTSLNAFDNVHHTYSISNNVGFIDDLESFGHANDGVKNISYSGNAVSGSGRYCFYAEGNYQTLSYVGNVAREVNQSGYYVGSGSATRPNQKASVIVGTNMLAADGNTSSGVFNLYDSGYNSDGLVISGSRFDGFGTGISVARESIIVDSTYITNSSIGLNLLHTGSCLGSVYTKNVDTFVKSANSSITHAVYSEDEPTNIIDNTGQKAGTIQSIREFQIAVTRTLNSAGGSKSYKLFTLPRYLDGRLRIQSSNGADQVTAFVVTGEVTWDGSTLNILRSTAYGGGASPPSGTPFTAEGGDLMIRINNQTGAELNTKIFVSFDGLYVA